MKVLITSATSAKAHKLKGFLQQQHDILLGDFIELPAFMGKTVIKLPNPAADAYAHQMLTLSLDNNIEQIYALTASEMNALVTAEQLFNEYNIKITDGNSYL
ncbi:hypothetical protein [Mucilaginibacter sp.]|uniref:hypothetical protein n=1 Tax=Mucilaginibacter sp. TaxID=1882438 RepID=UPI0035BBD95F